MGRAQRSAKQTLEYIVPYVRGNRREGSVVERELSEKIIVSLRQWIDSWQLVMSVDVPDKEGTSTRCSVTNRFSRFGNVTDMCACSANLQVLSFSVECWEELSCHRVKWTLKIDHSPAFLHDIPFHSQVGVLKSDKRIFSCEKY